MSVELPFTINDVPDSEVERQRKAGFHGEDFAPLVRTSPTNLILKSKYTSKLAAAFYNFEFRSDDIILLTYPKSGTVWMTEILWALTNIDNLDPLSDKGRPIFLDRDFVMSVPKDTNHPILRKFYSLCPEGNPEDGMCLQEAAAAQGRRILVTHLPLSHFNPTLIEKCKVVCVVRNPRDNCVSYYNHVQVLKLYDFQGSLDDFATLYMEGSVTYGSYWDHLKDCLRFKNHHNLHLVQFEDLKAKPASELQRLSDFLKLGMNLQQIDKVVEYTSFANMKDRDSKGLRNFGPKPTKGTFFRKGEAGDWKNNFSADLDKKMQSWIEKNSEHVDIELKYK